MRNASGSIAALLVLAALAGLAGPALCGTTRAAAMPCCETRGDCEAGLGRPSCCVDLPADGGAPASQAAATAAAAFAQAGAAPAPATSQLPGAPLAGHVLIDAALSADSPPLFLLHAVFLC